MRRHAQTRAMEWDARKGSKREGEGAGGREREEEAWPPEPTQRPRFRDCLPLASWSRGTTARDPLCPYCAQSGANTKLATQEKQLKTFLEANEALEADLRKQMQRVALLERRKLEQEAEQQTIEAYYQVSARSVGAAGGVEHGGV